MKTRIYSVRCFIGNRRRLTSRLKKAEARCFRIAALHLAKYLKQAYKL